MRIDEAQPKGKFTRGEGGGTSRITRFQGRLKGIVPAVIVRNKDAVLLVRQQRRQGAGTAYAEVASPKQAANRAGRTAAVLSFEIHIFFSICEPYS